MEKTKKAISINVVTVSICVALAILHVVIIVVILMINRSSSSLSAIMERSSERLEIVTSLQAGTSVLSETSSSFVLIPTTDEGAVNVGPLMSYASELSQPRRGQQVLDQLSQSGVTDEAVLAPLVVAAENSDAMQENQLHAIALMRSVYAIPDAPQLEAIADVPLTEEELAMSDEQREAAARSLILDITYAKRKETISQNVTRCVEMLRGQAREQAGVVGKRIGILRAILWATTISIVVLLALFFVTLYRQLINPLNSYVRLIGSDDRLDQTKGLREVRLLASAYNSVSKKRDALDAILRSAAETDALTNLPNRYRFEQYLVEAGDSGYSAAVLLFDINYLKHTNDTEGHLAGDQLIRDAADCIDRCFGESTGGACFRFGGDEFAAVLKNYSRTEVQERIRRFRELEREKDISVSIGSAYAKEMGNTSFKLLLGEADRNMYREKEKAHNQAAIHQPS